MNKRDKLRSIEHKRMKKENNYWTKEDDLLLTHIPYNGVTTKSPHILINKWFNRIKKNCFILKSPRENGKKKESENIL